MGNRISRALPLLFLAACVAQVDDVDRTPPTEELELHQSLLILDSHLDTPALFHSDGYTFGERGSFVDDGTNVDLPRLLEGGLDGGFWVIYTPQGDLTADAYVAARTSAVLRQMAIRELGARYADAVQLAFAANDADRIHDAGKIVVFQKHGKCLSAG